MAKLGFSLKEPMNRKDRRTALLGWGAGALVAAGAYVGAMQLLPASPSASLVATITAPDVDMITTGSIGARSSVLVGAPVQEQLDMLKMEVGMLREALAAAQAASTSTNRRLAELETIVPSFTASVNPTMGTPTEQPLPDILTSVAQTPEPRIVLPAPAGAGPVLTDGGAVQVTMRPLEIVMNDDGSLAAAQTESSAISQTPFAIDIGGAESLEGIDALWVERQIAFSGSLSDLSPRILLQTTSEGSLDLRLVAGPIDDAADAALLCAQLVAAGMERCLPAIFDGQQLALR